MAAFKRVTPPAAEPVALAEVRAFLRISHEDDDTLIERLAKAAREAGMSHFEGLALRVRGLLHTARGDSEAARAELAHLRELDRNALQAAKIPKNTED